jgi:hypothetical protein
MFEPPVDFAWKVRRRMLYDRNPLFITLQDKYAVKQYAGERGVETANLLFVTDRAETIPFDSLPPRCFIKANHGCGWNLLRLDGEIYDFFHGDNIFHPDGSFIGREEAARYSISRKQCVRALQIALRQKYSTVEWAYQHIPPKVIVEEFLLPRIGCNLKDYRMYAFDGAVKAINVGSPAYRRNVENVFFDPEWREFKLTRYKEKVPDFLPERPETLPEMIRTAELLGRGLDFVRIDLYDTTQGVVLGEMTLYPEAGQKNTPTACPVFNQWLGDQWVLSPRAGESC